MEVSQTVTKIVQPLDTIDRSRASASSKVSVAIMAKNMSESEVDKPGWSTMVNEERLGNRC